MRKTLVASAILASLVAAPAYAGTKVVSGTIFQNAAGTTVDWWRIDMPTGGTLTIDVLAYESSDNTIANGVDLNGDGKITFLDPDTNLFRYSGGPLSASNWILRCDDTGNSNGSCAPTIGSADGSINKRDPYFTVSLDPGSYIYAMGDYRTTTEEAIARLNAGDTLRNSTLADSGAYRITFSSTAAFSVSAVPEPETCAMLLAGLGLMGTIARRRRNL